MTKSWRDVLAIHPAAELFPRMSEDELHALGEDIKKNGLANRPVVWRAPDGTEYLLDGRNRCDAMEMAGIQFLNDQGARLLPWDETKIDPYVFVISANIHRRHLTAEQKRELIAKLLKAQPEKSDRQIAATVRVSPTTVGTVRAKMEATGDVSKLDTRTDRRGREQPAKRKPKSTEAQAAATERPAPPSRDDIGASSTGEAERLRARNEELEIMTHRLQRENDSLRMVDDVIDGEAAGLAALLRAWDHASQGARERFLARVGLQRAASPSNDDGLDIPASLRRAAS
jgi:hypothetical protein